MEVEGRGVGSARRAGEGGASVLAMITKDEAIINNSGGLRRGLLLVRPHTTVEAVRGGLQWV